ncbi:MAG: hypothetical protein FWC92_08140 [Defluviitaleaceae bacterium]|nr:hypothetical protein [Defluviitaleaceae bacterium]
MRVVTFCLIVVAVVLLLASCNGAAPPPSGDGMGEYISSPTPGPSLHPYNNGEDVYEYDNDEAPLPTPTPAQPVPAASGINLLIDEWLGWKPVVDANRGVGSRPRPGSLFERLNVPINIDVRQSVDLTAQSMADYLVSGEYNAIGLSVEQFAEVYYILYRQGFEAVMIYSPGYSTYMGGEFGSGGLFIGGIIVCASLLSQPQLVNSFVMGALRATFNYTYVRDSEGALARRPNLNHIRDIETHRYTSDDELANQLRYVSFYDRRHNLMVLHDRNIAENIFHAMWINRHGFALPRPSRGDLFDVAPLRAVQLPPGYTFEGNIVEVVYITVFFEPYCTEIRDYLNPYIQSEIDAVINVLNHRGEYDLNVHGFVSLLRGGEFTELGRDIAYGRAVSVMRRIADSGIDESRLTAINGGPLYADSEEERQQNRVVRIEYVR